MSITTKNGFSAAMLYRCLAPLSRSSCRDREQEPAEARHPHRLDNSDHEREEGQLLASRFMLPHAAADQVHALIRKEFERNKNESRPEVVEVCPCAFFSSLPPHAHLVTFCVPEPEEQRCCCSHALPVLCTAPYSPRRSFTIRLRSGFLSYRADIQQGRQGTGCQGIQVRSAAICCCACCA
jgi:hypothetical protein